MASAVDKLALAKRHLTRVPHASHEPTAKDDLFLYGFYALEAAVDCACLHFEEPIERNHWSRVDAARQLGQYGLDDVSDLLRDLNEGRKGVAYGESYRPEIDTEDLAARIEQFVESVSALLERGEVR